MSSEMSKGDKLIFCIRKAGYRMSRKCALCRLEGTITRQFQGSSRSFRGGRVATSCSRIDPKFPKIEKGVHHLRLRQRLCSLAFACIVGVFTAAPTEAQTVSVTGEINPALAPFDQLMTGLMQKYGLPGGQLAVTQNGRLVLAHGYGWADSENQVAVQPDSLFRIASLSKQLTSVAVLQLVQQGKLSLDDHAFAIFSDIQPLPGAVEDSRIAKITIRNLLQHSGGWDRDSTNYDPLFDSPHIASAVGVPSPPSAWDIIRYMLGRSLDFSPGTRFVYSNFGYAVLGRIIEKITGLAYEEYVRSNVLAPVGVTDMKIAHSLITGRQPGEVRYYMEPGTPLAQSVFDCSPGTVPWPYGGSYLEARDSAGGWLASAIDLLKFWNGIDGRRGSALLSQSSLQQMTARPSIPDWARSSSWYGMGFFIQPIGSDANWWHGGSFPGTRTWVVRTYNGYAWAALFNEGRNDPDLDNKFNRDLDIGLSYAYRAVTKWPSTDLFPSFAGVPSLGAPASSLQFNLVSGGGISRVTAGYPNCASVGYGTIKPDTGGTPSGLAVFGLRQNNVLVTEAGVPASPAIRSGRIYAEVNGPVNTGLAIANPNNVSATISFFFTDPSGDFGNGTMTIPANGQVATFLNQAPFNGKSPFSGAFTFSSSVPVSVVALRGLTNERNEFLITTLPVADLNGSLSTNTLVFPHFADGGGWTTQIVLVNPSDSLMTGFVQFLDPSGGNATVSVNGQVGSNFSYSIPARSSQKLQTGGIGSPATGGSVRVAPGTNNAAPSGMAIFSFKNAGVTVSEAGVPAVPQASAFRLYTEASGDFAHSAIGSIQTGIAVANMSSNAATVTLELFTLDGSSTGLTGTMPVPAAGQAAAFLNQIPGFDSMQTPFQGLLRVSSTTTISVVGLRGRYNERTDFLITTIPSLNEAAPASTGPLYFPHLADGGGYTTRFILFNGQAGQSSSGSLQLFTQSGTALNLTFR
jgi:CubicO group peptidase (beta-lactamase class C family)